MIGAARRRAAIETLGTDGAFAAAVPQTAPNVTDAAHALPSVVIAGAFAAAVLQTSPSVIEAARVALIVVTAGTREWSRVVDAVTLMMNCRTYREGIWSAAQA